MSTRLRKLPALACAAVTIGMLSSAAILGGAGAHPSDASAVHVAKRHHHARHHHARRHVAHGIPQHNGGDRDADNNGGPSDGDGTI